jgi:hypothetical protein
MRGIGNIAVGVCAIVGGALVAACGSDSAVTAHSLPSTAVDAGKTVKPMCATSSHGCRCSTETFTLTEDESVVSSCDEDSVGLKVNMECCYDLLSDGTSTSCDCVAYACKRDTAHDECVCGYYTDASATSDSVTSCLSNLKDTLCCQQPSAGDDENGCSCNGYYASCATRPGYESATRVNVCNTVTRTCDGKKNAKSCSGLKWAAPAGESSSSSSSSGGSSSGSPKPQCTSDSSCSSHCSSGCYQCRSGSCSCGYKGVSGSCIF